MLTTTVDGLWVLQAVTGIEQTCPELGLRPLLPRLDTPSGRCGTRRPPSWWPPARSTRPATSTR